MIKYVIVISIAVLCGIFIGFVLGVSEMSRRASDGVCIRADDGEAYLRISEGGQQKLMDPSTKLLYIRVVNMSTRNNHPL